MGFDKSGVVGDGGKKKAALKLEVRRIFVVEDEGVLVTVTTVL